MKIHKMILTVCVVGVLPMVGVAAAREKPDVLFIAVDDMNDWTTLFDKDNPIQTPNLVRLAERGCFFSRAYCTTPCCNPSRTAVMIGQRPTTSGVYGNRQDWRKYLPDVVSLPQYFKQNGYRANGAGKIFHRGNTVGEGNDTAFHEYYKPKKSDISRFKSKTAGTGPWTPSRKERGNLNGYTKAENKHLAGAAFDWGELNVEIQQDEYTVGYVGDVLENFPKDKPLFLGAGIHRPHLPFYAPPETFKRYPFESVVLPPMPEGDLDDVPAIGKVMAASQDFVFKHTSNKPDDDAGSLKKMVQCYQAASDYADEMVGRILDKLDETGRADNTIIVLWSDHGYHLGDKSSCVKFSLWEKSDHVPFVIVAPGVATPGTRCDKPVSLVDIYPTLVELAGLPAKSDIDGTSVVPLLKNPTQKWNPAITTMGPGNHAIRSDRWRYIRYKDGTEELYDHENDSWELNNVAAAYPEVIEEHKKWLPEKEAPMPEKYLNAWIYGPWDR
ncbi:sulfatase [Pontiella sulfatireligans]|uniref:Choline-sulfatase n=1 Tax=Pontiella sulfatireligans TaxID=2750658 RepID=A0A6C2UIR3_9BACT|nr:sulfatase [Pontiella sulfatireligans]SPS74313.1 sulfatase S1_7 [Kiritimatiellales bacterium]VGO19311.1 Choline-sulfatase [Pontiella sulfatireligans]